MSFHDNLPIEEEPQYEHDNWLSISTRKTNYAKREHI